MQNILSQWWVTGTIVSEIVSSLMLAFIVFTTGFIFNKRSETNKFYKWICLPFLYGFAGLVSIYSGMEVGNAVDGNGLALMSSPFTFIKAFYYDTYNLVIAAIGFQMIGSLIGVSAHLALTHLVVHIKQDGRKATDGLIFPEFDNKEMFSKEIIAQVLFVMALALLTIIDYGFSPKGNVYFGVFTSSIGITILFALFTKWFYFMLSPQLLIAGLIAGHFYKLTKLKHWVATAEHLGMQMAAICLVSLPEHAIRTR